VTDAEITAEPEERLERSGEEMSATRPGRPCARGKFLFVGDQKLYVRGVTYGTFHPNEASHDYPMAAMVERDFAQMRATGVNAIRTYTVPPRWLLDLAREYDLFAMVGLPWAEHMAILDDREQARSIERRVREGVRSCAGHPAVLCYAVGNEIPAPIVRWSGGKQIERYVRRLHDAAKSEDPDGLVTYVNYPSTEYLDLPFLDLACFNVYLEAEDPFESYLSRLQNLVGDRPLLMTEIGLDSRTHGEVGQARALRWQIGSAFKAGCAGAFVFAWTDEWHRGGHDIEDWDFGLTRRDRSAKPALASVRKAYAEIPFPHGQRWPRVSVVVCTYNGAQTLPDCLRGVSALDYPDFEVIVVDDGSTDASSSIAAEYGARRIRTSNRGLANARNTGVEAATGEIVAYLDDDAYPDPHWLRYLAASLLGTKDVAVGGPNVAPEGAGTIRDCVANSPGGPIHVLVSDREAEHIPGCNVAFWKAPLEAIGGFDPQFRAAGDDVDICWRLREQGHTIGYSPAAMVWHLPRSTVRGYWKQQRVYGSAEAALERKWPHMYNSLGHTHWTGRVYGSRRTRGLGRRRDRVRYGVWGTGLFQSVYQRADGTIASLPLMPEWYLVIAALAMIGAVGALWPPLLLSLPVLAAAIGIPMIQAFRSAARATRTRRGRLRRLEEVTLTAALHLLQPAARLRGRLAGGLAPWRRPGRTGVVVPRARTSTLWSERSRTISDWLGSLENWMLLRSVGVRRGGECDRWDLAVRGGILGGARLRMVIEDHGGGRQLLRFRFWPRCSLAGLAAVLVFLALALGAGVDEAWIAAVVLAGVSAVLSARMLWESGAAAGLLLKGIVALGQELGSPDASKPSRTSRPTQGLSTGGA
jgi:O-antigen biosynthesis protein